jgi:hypothetical protein
MKQDWNCLCTGFSMLTGLSALDKDLVAGERDPLNMHRFHS